MKNFSTAALVCCLILTSAHLVLGADAKNDPSQFPLAVHVSASTYAIPTNTGYGYELVTATIGGKHYQLGGPPKGNGLLNPGDYQARLSMDVHKTRYESLQQFEILFPDGTTRRFDVIAQSE